MTKRAVIVGINDYTGIDATGSSNLGCSVADAQSIQQLVTASLGFDAANVTLVTDGAATRSAVLAALQAMIAASQPGDVALLFYSGHGSIEPDDPSAPTCEKFYESICTATRPFLTDKDLFGVASQLQQSVVNFTVIADSCHSGGLDQETDAVAKYRSIAYGSDLATRIQKYMTTYIPVGIAVPTGSGACANDVSNVSISEGGVLVCEEDPSQIFVPLAKMTLLSGCKFWELSWESSGHGLLTRAILDTVNASDFSMSYGDFATAVQTRVAQLFATLTPGANDPTSQTPQLRGQANRMTEGFLQAWSQSK